MQILIGPSRPDLSTENTKHMPLLNLKMLDPVTNDNLALAKTPAVRPYDNCCVCVPNLADMHRILGEAHPV
jgi:hypothetical protein